MRFGLSSIRLNVEMPCTAWKRREHPRCNEKHRYAHSLWRRPEFHSRLDSPSHPSHRPTGDHTAPVDHTRATGITRSGVPAGTTATRRPAGHPRSAGRRHRTGSHPPGGIPHPAGRRRQDGSDLAPDRFSICSTRCVARRPSSGPARFWAGSEPVKDRVDDVVADADARTGHDRLTEPAAEESL